MRKSLILLSLTWVVGVMCYGQQSELQSRFFKDKSGSTELHDHNQGKIKKTSKGIRVKDIRSSFRAAETAEVTKTKSDNSSQTMRKNLPLSRQRFSTQVTAYDFPFQSTTDDTKQQCAYTFTLLDSYGDGWNGALMHVIQNSQIIAVLGAEFYDGYEYVQQVNLTNGLDFAVLWYEGGGWPGEVGLKITDPFGEDIYFAEFLSWDQIGTVLFSDVAICTPPTCPRPVNLQLVSVDSETALINWTENGTATQWDLEYGAPGFSEGAGTLVPGITVKPFEITGLEPATHYEVRVRAICSEEDLSLWSVRFKFATTCLPFDVPYLENFDQVSAPLFPLCYSVLTTGYWALAEVTDYTSNSSPNSVVLTYDYESAVYLVLPEFDSDLNDLFITFSSMLNYGFNQLELGVLTNPNDPGTYVMVQSFSITESWNTFIAEFSDYAGTNGHIAFKYGYVNDNYYGVVLLDDIFVGIMEDCQSPIQLGANNITFESARLNWIPFGPAQEWEVEYGIQGFEQGQGILFEDITQTFVDVTNLEENTFYQFYVRSVCDEETGSWSLPYTFKTRVEGECSYTFVLQDTYGDGWDETRMHVIQEGEIVAILGANFQDGYSFPVDVLLMDGLEFQVFWAVEGYYPDEIGLEIIDPFGDQLYYEVPIGWTMVGQTIFSDIAICTIPTCPRPNNLSVSEITTESALLNWSETGTAAQWDIEYGEAGFTEGQGTIISNINSKPHLLTGLESATMYEFRVRAICSEEDISYWSLRRNFTTLCEEFSLPLTEGFDNATPPLLPLCWTELGEGEYYFIETTDYFYASSPNSVVMAHDYFSFAMLIAPPVEEVITNVQLKFKAMYYDGINKLNVGLITDPSDESTFTTIQTITLSAMGAWTEHLVYFADYAGVDGQIAFRIGSLEEMNYSIVLIDDIEIDYLPSCPAPYNLNVSGITTSSALLQWNDIGPGTEWEIEWGLAPFSPGTGTLVQGITQTSYQLTGLSGSSFYQFYVRSVCSESETSEWSFGHTFATLCDDLELPFTDNFDNLSDSELPLCWNMSGIGNWGWNYYVGATSWQYFSPPMSMAIYQDYTLAMLISPPIGEPLNSLEVRFHALHAEGEDNSLQIGAITDPANITGFEVINSVSATPQWKQYTMSLANYSGSASYLAFALGSQGAQKWGTVLIDNLEIVVSEPVYNVTFKIHNSNLEPIAGASIEIEGEGTIITQANGEATHGLHNGHYQFTINAEDYLVHSGDFTIINDHLVVEIVLIHVNVEENLFPGLVVYPNPFTDILQVNNATSVHRIVITNTLGQTMTERILTGDPLVKIDTSHLGRGIYFLELYDNYGAKQTRKIIKK